MFIPPSLRQLSFSLSEPLYLVGGYVRDALLRRTASRPDYDLASPVSDEQLVLTAKSLGFCVKAVYPGMGTVKLADKDGNDYEFTRFRSDTYVRGTHSPVSVSFTKDIVVDAKRRDFRSNAVYYDVKAERFVDPLDGVNDIKARKLRTVDNAKKVFGEDGLRLMRLCRQSAQLGFTPDEECLEGAKENANLILDIVPERILTELKLLLRSDEVSEDAWAPYRGLALMRDTGIMQRLFPDLYLGHGMAQRSDFHAHDVLEHSLRCVRYAPEEIRLSALFHDVGKPFCTLRDGNSHEHPVEGARLTKEILTALKAPKKETEEAEQLVLYHMVDFDCKMKENKLRRFFVLHAPILERLLALKQADFSACMDDTSEAPTVKKWRALLEKMKAEKAPLTLAELAVRGADIRGMVPDNRIGEVLKELLLYTALDGKLNQKEKLLTYVSKHYGEKI